MTAGRGRQGDATKRISPAGLLLALVLTVPATERPLAFAEPSAKAKPATGPKPTAESTCSLRIMTLNVAHGRGTGGHQATQSREQIAGNLQKVADLIRRHRPDVLALQEADGPSVWSGWFDHVQWLSDKTQMEHRFRGAHVDRVGLCYGTAIVSRYTLLEPFSVTFTPSPPTPRKGFVAAKLAWPGRPDVLLQVVSVHLDFAQPAVRRRQVEEMAKRLAENKHPRVVMGDFNAQWSDRRSAVRSAADALGLRAYRPDKNKPYTFPPLKRRLDWILISEELEFEEYSTLPDTVSDHRAVLAVLRLAAQRTAEQDAGRNGAQRPKP